MEKVNSPQRQVPQLDLEKMRRDGLILLETVSGSNAYGTALPTSDRDVRGVFILPEEDLLGGRYTPQVNDDSQDVIFYELGRFLELVTANNPNILELLNAPEDCVVYKHPLFDLVLARRGEFLTKRCRASFGGYAVEQIKKARGLNKKIANPVEPERKTVLDFCYVPKHQGSELLSDWAAREGLPVDDLGLVAIDHMRYTYHVFVGSELLGVVDAKGENVITSTVPKGQQPVAIMQFNKDGYSTYCRTFKEYWEWVAKRNPHRYAANVANEKNYDAKNMMHSFRLLHMAHEIAAGDGVVVRRPDAAFLLEVRAAKHEYQALVDRAEALIVSMDEAFDASDLPEFVDANLGYDLQREIRRQFYASGR